MPTNTVLLCGVGGQGTILAADLLAQAALEAGFVVKVSEIHGMAQRGGSVSTVMRSGDNVDSMVSDIGVADVIVSFETTEALRNIDQLKCGGSLVVNDEIIKPLPVLIGKAQMPEQVREDLLKHDALLIPAADIALDIGNVKTLNVVLLGALSVLLDFPLQAWQTAVKNRVPSNTVDMNLNALNAGRTFINSKD